MVRVLVVDDHAGFRAAARALLEAAGYQVTGEAADGPSAVALTAELHPEPAVVLVSSHDAGTYGRRLADAPVVGFVTKSELSGAALARLLG